MLLWLGVVLVKVMIIAQLMRQGCTLLLCILVDVVAAVAVVAVHWPSVCHKALGVGVQSSRLLSGLQLVYIGYIG